MIEGVHMASVLCGPFSLDAPDPTVFRGHAAERGIEDAAHVSAGSEVPVVGRERVRATLGLMTTVAERLGALGLARCRRRTDEAAIREDQERLELVLQGADLGTWDFDVRTGRMIPNERSAQVLGYRLEDLNLDVQTWGKLIHADDQPGVTACWNEHLEGKTPFFQSEHRLRHVSGNWVYVLSKGKVVERDAQGRPLRVCGTLLDITDRKRTEESLRYQRVLLESQSEASIDGILVVSPEDMIVSHNRRFAEMWTIPREPLAARVDSTVLALVVDQVICPEEFLARVRYLYEHRDEESRDEIFLKDGRVFDRYSSPIRDVDGTYYGRVWFFRDITNRKRAENALRESEEKFSKVFRTAPDGICITRLKDGLFLDVNPGFEATSGFSRAEVIGRTSLELNFWGDPRDRQEMVEALLSKGEILHREFSLRHKNGTSRICVCSARSIVIAGESCLLFVMHDITERKRDEERLRESEGTIRSLFNSAAIGIALSANRIILDVNAQFCDIIGYTREELLGQNSRICYSDEGEYVRIGNELWSAQHDLRRVDTESRWRRKDGKVIDVLLSMTVMESRKPEETRVTVTVVDITDRKRAERERAELHDRLQQVEKLNALGELAAGVAHDFNNLLSVMQAHTYLALGLASAKVKHPHLDAIQNAIGRAADMTRSLLTFSRGLRSERQRVHVIDLVRDALRLIQYALPTGVKLVSEETCNRECRVEVNPTQFQQVMLNLAINARDAMPEGGTLRIAVATARFRKVGKGSRSRRPKLSWVQISVSDTGTGIAPEVRDRVFEPFFTTKPRGQGTGLGLSIVQGVITEYGGTIEVQSETGVGTTFVILLPCVESAGSSVE